MSGSKISQLNEGLHTLKEELISDKIAASRVEIAIITFGSDITIVQDFVTAEYFNPPILSPAGATPMGQAINLALDKLQTRKALYRENGVAYYRPWVFLITDGEPTDDEWQSAAQRVTEQENNKKVAFFCIGVEDANMEILGQISPRQPAKLRGLEFQAMFKWLSASLTQVSHSNVGEQVALEPPRWTV
jgi:uncharacterized protein YegL